MRYRSGYGSYRRRRNGSKSAWGLILGLMVGAGVYMFTSPLFEREDPVIMSDNNIYWNRKDPLKISISDNMGLKSYKVTISDGKNSVVVADEPIVEPFVKEERQ